MNLRTLPTGLCVGLAAIILAGCSSGPFGYIVEREEPTPTRVDHGRPRPPLCRRA
jgi:hypothetical protein